MQLTSFTDYGLRALIYMASLPDGRMTSISEVTEVYGVSRNHMVKIINQLSRVGYVTAVLGKNGVDSSGKPANMIRVGDVVRDLEPLSLVNCSSEFCHITPACRLKQALAVPRKVFSRNWITTRWPIWLKRINRFINYYWWSDVNFTGDDNGVNRHVTRSFPGPRI